MTTKKLAVRTGPAAPPPAPLLTSASASAPASLRAWRSVLWQRSAGQQPDREPFSFAAECDREKLMGDPEAESPAAAERRWRGNQAHVGVVGAGAGVADGDDHSIGCRPHSHRHGWSAVGDGVGDRLARGEYEPPDLLLGQAGVSSGVLHGRTAQCRGRVGELDGWRVRLERVGWWRQGEDERPGVLVAVVG